MDHSERDRLCAFCADRLLETPPEKSRIVRRPDGGHEILRAVPVEELDATVAEFRRVPNLFEILSFDYWHANHGFELPDDARARQDVYLASERGREHVRAVVAAKRRAAGLPPADLDEAALREASAGFFGGGHDVIIGRRHLTDGAADDHALASSGTLTPDEHHAFLALTVDAAADLYAQNPHVRYVSVFQNWLKPAGASFDHLHKQVVAIDEVGTQNEAALAALARDPDVFETAAVGYAAEQGLAIAQTEHAVLFAGFGHRYPTLEVHSLVPADPWEHSEAQLCGVSDLLHAAHAASGADVPCNEEWHTRPRGIDAALPWRICLKWRVSTLAGFEGATKIYLNTLSPWDVRDRVADRLQELRVQGRIAASVRLVDGAGPDAVIPSASA